MIDTGKTGEFRYPVSSITDQDETTAGITPSQTVGPYVHIGLSLEGSERMAGPGDGDAQEISFTVLDGAGDPIADAMIEIWQTRPDGTFNAPNDPRTGTAATVEGFRGLGRGMVDDSGTTTFTTLLPGSFEGQAPHLNVGVFARGMLERLFTRLYFPENTAANAADPVLQAVAESRRGNLIAERTERGYHLTVHVQHEDPDLETPFFRV
ncbi:MAG TPA: protocatechuate 3,4-dioxygenase subunit alpha [Corynebacterium sp.]|nr:protocatechuate 3,4-dioxygenase subunit alpha [Corynebacterium sp.]